ncbi:hypothetical protein F5Y12DRAFT_606306 [Xylaria sp. FL1777]|nr:hypothetical protein F5Y12DRAFT_606306 [Xylaria sp. FL1777]
MFSLNGHPSSPDEQQLDDEVAAFLQGSEPAKSSTKPELVIMNMTETPMGSELSNQHDPPFHMPLDRSSLSTQVNDTPIPTACSPQSSTADEAYTIITTVSSISETNSPSDSLPLRPQQSQIGASSSLYEPSSLFTQVRPDFQVPFNEKTAESTLPEESDSPIPIGILSENVPPAEGPDSDQDDLSTIPAIHIANNDQKPDEVLVVVMGPHGSGKSAFISSVTRTHNRTNGATRSSNGLDSHFVAHLGNNYHLLETLGFDNELEIEVVIRRTLLWLENYYGSGKNPANTTFLYLHPIREPRFRGSTRRSLDTFKSLIDPGTWPQVVLGTTGWTAAERQTPGLAEKREAELLSSPKFWKDMYSRGAGIMRIPEQDVFARDILGRLRERISSQSLQRRDSVASAAPDDRTPILQRKADYLEYERRLLEMVSQIRSGDHRVRIAPPSSAFQLICNECRGNCGVGDVYQCQECYQDTSQESFMLCSDCYYAGKSCDKPEHRKSMQKKKVKDVSCKSHAKTNLQGWDSIPCSCCDDYCDIVFLHCCDCLHDSFNMCLACMKDGSTCESEKHSLHIVCWWKGKGGLASETVQPPLSDYLRTKGDDLIEYVGGHECTTRYNGDGRRRDPSQKSPVRGNAASADSTAMGPRLRAFGKATADLLKAVWDSD